MKSGIIEEIRADFAAAADSEFRLFQCRLMPTVAAERVIGVRTPQLRAWARVYEKDPRIAEFLTDLPHFYFEENNLHAFLISRCRNFEETIVRINDFLPYIDNWATCDQLRPTVFRSHVDALRKEIMRWMASDHVYTLRFGIGMLMTHCLGASFEPEDLARVAAVLHEDYYVKMMVAWYFATALAKQWEDALRYITEHRLEDWTHRKTISKALQSNRLTDSQKAYLRALKS